MKKILCTAVAVIGVCGICDGMEKDLGGGVMGLSSSPHHKPTFEPVESQYVSPAASPEMRERLDFTRPLSEWPEIYQMMYMRISSAHQNLDDIEKGFIDHEHMSEVIKEAIQDWDYAIKMCQERGVKSSEIYKYADQCASLVSNYRTRK